MRRCLCDPFSLLTFSRVFNADITKEKDKDKDPRSNMECIHAASNVILLEMSRRMNHGVA